MVAGCLVWIALASAPGSLHARLEAMREQVLQNRELQAEERTLLGARLAVVDSRLSEVEEIAARGEERKQKMAPVMVAGTALVADDASGLGVADDALLPAVALAAVVVHLRTQASASDQELQAALGRLESAIQAAIETGQVVLMAQQQAQKLRGLTGQLVQTLARYLGRGVGGKPPDHQRDPKKDRPGWWDEIEAALEQIQGLISRHRWSPVQIQKLLDKVFTRAQQVEIREALNEVAKLQGEKPPDFPPLVAP